MNKEAREALRKVIEYSLEDEQKHWEEAGCPNEHIYLAIKRLEDWYNYTTPRTCRCCGCTNRTECEGDCEWSTIDPTLCTNCERCPEAK